MTRTSTARTSVKEAARHRRKHERVISEQPDAVRRLRRAISFVLAEIKRQPHMTDYAVDEVTRLAVELNGRRSQ